MIKINFFTDGACNDKKYGGWAFYNPELNILVCGNKQNTTNNEMELKAIGSVLKYIVQSKITKKEIIIHSDSAWSIGAILNEWELTHHINYVKNIKEVIKQLKINNDVIIKFNKVKGHNNIFENELCDFFAVIMSNKN